MLIEYNLNSNYFLHSSSTELFKKKYIFSSIHVNQIIKDAEATYYRGLKDMAKDRKK
jgi:hypothetical protein